MQSKLSMRVVSLAPPRAFPLIFSIPITLWLHPLAFMSPRWKIDMSRPRWVVWFNISRDPRLVPPPLRLGCESAHCAWWKTSDDTSSNSDRIVRVCMVII
ncbi:hypothetical protein R3P38DRAFT_3153630 [Favolaschia claudopus]|uniref:Secreted protein n=1 Tax=Favolaschia claudopus TaxID=2862362 RepID=A0AAV9Z013_9AGAR